MRKYKIASVLWIDHRKVTRSRMVSDPEGLLLPTLSVGIIYKETKKYIVLVSDIEKYEDNDDATYLIILKPVLATKTYGEIELEELRT